MAATRGNYSRVDLFVSGEIFGRVEHPRYSRSPGGVMTFDLMLVRWIAGPARLRTRAEIMRRPELATLETRAPEFFGSVSYSQLENCEMRETKSRQTAKETKHSHAKLLAVTNSLHPARARLRLRHSPAAQPVALPPAHHTTKTSTPRKNARNASQKQAPPALKSHRLVRHLQAPTRRLQFQPSPCENFRCSARARGSRVPRLQHDPHSRVIQDPGKSSRYLDRSILRFESQFEQCRRPSGPRTGGEQADHCGRDCKA